MDNINIDNNITGDPQQESRACCLHNNSSLTRLNPFSTPRRELKRRRRTPRQPRLEAPEATASLGEQEESKAARNDDNDEDGLNDGLNDESKLSKRFKKRSTPFVDVDMDGSYAKIVRINPMICLEQTEFESFLTVKYLQEFCKPGGGILTMDFCTLGLSFIGECVQTSSYYHSIKLRTRREDGAFGKPSS